MKIALLLAVCAALCSGCSVTLSASAQRSGDQTAATELKALQEQSEKQSALVRNMVAELEAAPNDIAAVNAVLAKYGVNRRETK